MTSCRKVHGSASARSGSSWQMSSAESGAMTQGLSIKQCKRQSLHVMLRTSSSWQPAVPSRAPMCSRLDASVERGCLL